MHTPKVLDASATSPNSTARQSRRPSDRYRSAQTNSAAAARAGRATAARRAPRKAAATSRPRRRFLPKILIPLAVLVALVGAYVGLYNSNLFTLESVTVSGNERLSADYLLEIAAVPANSTFLRLDSEGISARLSAEPWVATVSLEKVFPTGLVIHVVERSVAAVVDIVPERATDSTTHWVIDDEAVWIASVDAQDGGRVALDAEQLAGFIRLKDVSPAVRPQAGASESDAGIQNALAIIQGFSEEMRKMVATISAPDAVKTTLTLENNVGVAFGEAVDIKAKEDAIATLLEEHQGTITYINVRVANRATYRSTQ